MQGYSDATLIPIPDYDTYSMDSIDVGGQVGGQAPAPVQGQNPAPAPLPNYNVFDGFFAKTIIRMYGLVYK